MNKKNSKVPIYIAILVAVLLIAAGGYFSQTAKQPKEIPVATPEKMPVATLTPVKTALVDTPVVVTTPKIETIKCELCHIGAQDLKPHVNGGKLCISCHGSQVHNIHIGPGTVGLNCDTCHGFPPKIPSVEKGEEPGRYSVCENCHAAPPDSLKPSYGNLVIVHLSRNKYCTNCHGTDIGAIHMAALANGSKNR